MALDSCRVVLVGTQFAKNAGAAARVMRNMGLVDLALVRPEFDPADREARKLSTQGEAILDAARSVDDLGAATADCHLVIGTTARISGVVRQQSIGRPDEIFKLAAATLAWGKVAVVFGPERTGLENADAMRCHHLVHLPTSPDYPALNLSQAVAICLYELRKQWLDQTESPAPEAAVAPFADQERMLEQLRLSLDQIRFLRGDRADSLFHAVRHFIGRREPTAMEVDMLMGLARQIQWYVRRDGANDAENTSHR